MTTFERVYAAVRLIPRGSVATYGQIARQIATAYGKDSMSSQAATRGSLAWWATRCTSTPSRE